MEPMTSKELREAPKYAATLVALMIEGVKDRAFPLEAAQRLEAAGYLSMLEDGAADVPAAVEAMVRATDEWKGYTKAKEEEAQEFYRMEAARHKILREKMKAHRKEARARA